MKLEILDSTLREGEQASGIKLSVEAKLEIAKRLAALGIDYIEGGNPSSGTKDKEFFKLAAAVPELKARLVAFGMTRQKDISADKDKFLRALAEAGTDTVSVVGKASALQAERVLKVGREQNLIMIEDTVKYLTARNKRVFFDAEHFFDAMSSDSEYALKTLETAENAGAELIVLCDTNGGALPDQIAEGVKAALRIVKHARIGVHTHEDGGLGSANAIAGVCAGASHVQGTFLGYGERCGNAPLCALIPCFALKLNYECEAGKKLSEFTEASRVIATLMGRSVPPCMPYVGENAFAHKAGMHVDGVIKYAPSFEHIEPSLVGNTRKIMLSEMSGRAVVADKLKKYYPDRIIEKDELQQILDRLKMLECDGYQFDGADASVLLTAKKVLGEYKPSFELISYKCISEQPAENGFATAIIKISVAGKERMSAAQGEGPVNALDTALRIALKKFYPVISAVRLKDYTVRVINYANTASLVRVEITSSDGEDEWRTVGVSKDIIEASWIALADSIDYKLMNAD